MKTSRLPAGPSRPLSLFAVIALLALGGSLARAIDISGYYADKGTIVRAGQIADDAPEVMSLHALLNLEFDPALAGVLFAETTRVDLVQAGRVLESRIHSPDGVLRWQGEYWFDDGRSPDAMSSHSRVILTLRKANARDSHLLIFELVGEDKSLLVTALRISSTIIGPSAQPVGTYLFSRLP